MTAGAAGLAQVYALFQRYQRAKAERREWDMAEAMRHVCAQLAASGPPELQVRRPCEQAPGESTAAISPRRHSAARAKAFTGFSSTPAATMRPTSQRQNATTNSEIPTFATTLEVRLQRFGDRRRNNDFLFRVGDFIAKTPAAAWPLLV